MANGDGYSAYITAVSGLESTLSNAQAEIERSKRQIQQKAAAAENNEKDKLKQFDHTIQRFESSYSAVVDELAKNTELGVNIPQKVRPTITQQQPNILASEQKRLINDISSKLDLFRKACSQEADQRKAQAALKALEAKRAAAALAARRAALERNPPKPAPEVPKKLPYVLIACAAAAVIAVVVVIIFVL